MAKSIFNIEQEYIDILDQLEELEGELTPELAKLLEINEAELEKKVEAYVYRIKEWQANIGLAKDEIDRYKQLIEANENKIKTAKQTIQDAVNLYGSATKSGGKQLKYLFANIYTSTTKALKLDESFYDTKYMTWANKLSEREINHLLELNYPDKDYFATPVIDNKSVKEDIIAGETVEGAEIVINEHIVIR